MAQPLPLPLRRVPAQGRAAAAVAPRPKPALRVVPLPAAPRWSPALFAARAALFFAPVALVLGALEAALWRTGESWPAARVVEAQGLQPDAVFLRGLLDQSFHAYKLAGLQRARPRILALGSSRVMKLRGPMFGDDAAAFYNAGGLVVNVEDLAAFVEGLPGELLPRVVLLGVDMWWLNAVKPAERHLSWAASEDGALDWRGHLFALRAILRRPAQAGRLWRALEAEDEDRIGIEARISGEGFRADGSLAGGRPAPRAPQAWGFVDRERPPIARQIRRGIGFFPVSDGVSPARLARLRDAVAALRDRGVLVVGFGPPVYSGAAELLEADPRHRRLWREYREHVPRVFEELGQPFVDASTPAVLGLDDRYMTDGFHAEETFHLHLLRRVLADGRAARALPAALAAVKQALASPGTNPWYADFPATAGQTARRAVAPGPAGS